MLMCIKKLEHWHRAMDIWVITIIYIPDEGNSQLKGRVRGRKEGQESFMYSYMSKKPMWLMSEAWYRVDSIEVGEWRRGQILAGLRVRQGVCILFHMLLERCKPWDNVIQCAYLRKMTQSAINLKSKLLTQLLDETLGDYAQWGGKSQSQKVTYDMIAFIQHCWMTL